MRCTAGQLIAAEIKARMTEHTADEAWIDWCRAAVSRGVRCDVEPQSFKQVLWLIDVGNGVSVLRQPREET